MDTISSCAYPFYGCTSFADFLSPDEIVLPNSTIANIDETNYPEIYFGLRGAASSFGIVSKFTARTFAAPAKAAFNAYTWDLSPGDATRYLLTWQDYGMQHAPKELGMGLTLGKGSTAGRL